MTPVCHLSRAPRIDTNCAMALTTQIHSPPEPQEPSSRMGVIAAALVVLTGIAVAPALSADRPSREQSHSEQNDKTKPAARSEDEAKSRRATEKPLRTETNASTDNLPTVTDASPLASKTPKSPTDSEAEPSAESSNDAFRKKTIQRTSQSTRRSSQSPTLPTPAQDPTATPEPAEPAPATGPIPDNPF